MAPAEKCVCCGSTNDFSMINRETCRNSGVVVSINRQGMLRFRYYPPMMDGSGSFVTVFETQDNINLKYCPFCGREFEKKIK